MKDLKLARFLATHFRFPLKSLPLPPLLPNRQIGHTLEVEVKDTLANTSRYILSPQGGQ